jgi:lysophospholipase L1-like esterase
MKVISAALAILSVVGFAMVAQVQAANAPVAAAAAVPAEKVDLLANKRVMILGDSITENGTYVSYLEYFLNKAHSGKSFDIISIGLSSETVSGLSEKGGSRPCVNERLQRSLDAIKPQLVIVCYGMNDGLYQPYSEANMKAFQDGMTKLVETCQAAGAQVILVTPPIFEGGAYDQVLGKFAEWEVAHPPKGTAAIVDLHAAMAAARAERQKANPEFRFSGDNVHPGELGHIVMAQAILQRLAIPMSQGTAEELQKSAQADPLFKLVCQHRGNRSSGWRNGIGQANERSAPNYGSLATVEVAAKALQSKIDVMRK